MGVLFKEFQIPESCLRCPFKYVVRPSMVMYCGLEGGKTTDCEVGIYRKSRHPDCQMEEYPDPKPKPKVKKRKEEADVLFMAVTNDQYELPVAIEDTKAELARKVGVSESLVGKYVKGTIIPGKNARYRFYAV